MLRRIAWVLICISLSGCAGLDHTVRDKQLISDSLDRWEQRVFTRPSQYRIVAVNTGDEIHAESQDSASALYRSIEVDLQQTPFLNWQWKVDQFSHQRNQYEKSGDDFAARIYVVAKVGLLPFDSYAINFVWSNDNELRRWLNPFSDRSQVVALQRRRDAKEGWKTQKMNVPAEFRRAFDLDVQQIDIVAIMVDTDSAGGSARSAFRQLYFSAD